MGLKTVVFILTLTSATTAAELPGAAVTGRQNGEERIYTHEDGRDMTAVGLTMAVFSTARLAFPATRERWEAAIQANDHVRVSFVEPVTLRANTGGAKGTTYAVDEILVDTTPFVDRPPLPTPNGQGFIAFGDNVDPGLEDSLLIRSGGKYFSFIKYEGILAVPLIAIYGPR